MIEKGYIEKAARILSAIENSPVPVEWSEMDRYDLTAVIAKELKKMEREELRKEKGPEPTKAIRA